MRGQRSPHPYAPPSGHPCPFLRASAVLIHFEFITTATNIPGTCPWISLRDSQRTKKIILGACTTIHHIQHRLPRLPLGPVLPRNYPPSTYTCSEHLPSEYSSSARASDLRPCGLLENPNHRMEINAPSSPTPQSQTPSAR